MIDALAALSGRRRSWTKIAVFVALTFAFSSVFYALILNNEELRGAEQFYVTGLMWSPALAALIAQRAFGERVAALGWAWGPARYQAWAYLMPLAYAVPVYLLVWLSGLGQFDLAGFAASKAESFGWRNAAPIVVLAGYVLLAGTAGVILSLARALGEEIGWRGFLVPELSRVTGFHGVAVISGLIWAAWHFPILLFGDYNAGTPALYSLTCFTLMVIGVSYVMAWLRLASGTLWTAALAHAVHNRYIQGVLTPLTADTGNTAYVIDEFGIGLALSALIAALLIARYRKVQSK